MKLKGMLEECGAVKYGDFTLTSGKKSDYYVDIKLASTKPWILKEIAGAMHPHVDGGVIAGMELGAVPIATALALETGLPFVIIRKEKKGHGTKGRIEGELEQDCTVTVVEDVITTGLSSVETVRVIREQGARINRVLVVVDRQEGGREALEDAGVELISLLKGDELKR